MSTASTTIAIIALLDFLAADSGAAPFFRPLAESEASGGFAEATGAAPVLLIATFCANENEEIILKTVFPNRKLHKKFGGKE